MAGLEGTEVEVKMLHGSGALAMIPTVGQQHSAYIEKDHVEGEHRRLSLYISVMNS
jgi:hypothetical protein